jgi:DNA replication protein DnaD
MSLTDVNKFEEKQRERLEKAQNETDDKPQSPSSSPIPE